MPTLIITPQEFCEQHGQSGQPVKLGSVWLYPDGAEFHENSETMVEPPESRYELLLQRRRFLREKLRLATVDFDRERKALLEQISNAAQYGNLPEPTQGDIVILRELRSECEKADRALLTCETALSATVEGKRREAKRQQAEERRARMSALAGELAGIEFQPANRIPSRAEPGPLSRT